MGNSCPSLYHAGTDTYVIASPAYDEDDDVTPAGLKSSVDLQEQNRLAGITTDLWAYSIADFEHWKSRGGDPDALSWSDTVVDVTPGTYRFTHHTGERGFDYDTPRPLVFAHIQRIS